MIVKTSPKTSYTSLPEDGPEIFDQISLTLFRASMFHKGWNAWIIEVTNDELSRLLLTSNIQQFIHLEPYTFKGVKLKLIEDKCHV